MPRIQNKFGLSIVGALLLLAIAALAGGVFAGPLNPPGTPAPTQETQINSLPYTISASGSYILTGTLTCTTCTAGQNGITVSADDVTIDLKGFALIGVAGSAWGVQVSAAHKGVSIGNGNVRGWGGGGVDFLNASESRITHLTTVDMLLGADGIHLGDQSTLTDCISSSNYRGVYINGGSNVITGCDFSANMSRGLEADGNDNRITENHASGNGPGFCNAGVCAGFAIFGNNNTIEDNSASHNQEGFYTQTGNLVFRNNASANTPTGNYVSGGGDDIGAITTAAAQTSPAGNISN
jgi:parallel beta-helix repeat protein